MCGCGRVRVRVREEDDIVILMRVISGGQTGADQGGLEGAKMSGVETGGMAPRGYRTSSGPQPDLEGRFGLEESKWDAYHSRTRHNVYHSDGTVIFGDPISPGSMLTYRLCREYKKPRLQILYPGMTRISAEGLLAQWCVLHCIEVLNVAGNREDKNPGIQVFVSRVVLGTIERMRKVCIL